MRLGQMRTDSRRSCGDARRPWTPREIAVHAGLGRLRRGMHAVARRPTQLRRVRPRVPGPHHVQRGALHMNSSRLAIHWLIVFACVLVAGFPARATTQFLYDGGRPASLVVGGSARLYSIVLNGGNCQLASTTSTGDWTLVSFPTYSDGTHVTTFYCASGVQGVVPGSGASRLFLVAYPAGTHAAGLWDFTPDTSPGARGRVPTRIHFPVRQAPGSVT